MLDRWAGFDLGLWQAFADFPEGGSLVEALRDGSVVEHTVFQRAFEHLIDCRSHRVRFIENADFDQ